MTNLEKIQKGMKVLQILSRIALILIGVGLVLSSVSAALVAADVLNSENQFFHFLWVEAGVGKQELVGILTSSAVALLFSGVLGALTYRYFTAELKDGTPFTSAGADRIRLLGIVTLVVNLVSEWITEEIYEKIALAEWNRFDGAGSITFGIFLILLSVVIRYGAELEHK